MTMIDLKHARRMQMENELPMSVRSELAEARAVADRCRRLEAELRDRERELYECRDELDRWIADHEEGARERDALREQVTTLRTMLDRAKILIPGHVRKFPLCDCAKLPHRHNYDIRSCTGEASE